MKKNDAKRLGLGDRVRLAKPFRFGKEQLGESEPDWDLAIKSAGSGGVVTSGLDMDDTMLIRWDRPPTGEQLELWTHREVLEEKFPPATDKEVEEAIKSIIGTRR